MAALTTTIPVNIPHVDYSAISVEKMNVAVDETSIDQAMLVFAKNHQEFAVRSGPAEKDDRVTFGFIGKVGTEVINAGTDHVTVRLGHGEFPVDAVEDGLVGMKEGESKAISTSFHGQAAVFECNVIRVEQPVAVVINDAFAASLGLADVAALRKRVGEEVAKEFADLVQVMQKRSLMDQLDTILQYDLPSEMIEAEAQAVAHDLWHEENGHDHHNHPNLVITPEHRVIASRRVRLGLFLGKVCKEANISVSDEEFEAVLVQQAHHYPGKEDQFMAFAKQDQRIREQITAPMMEDRAMEHLFGLIKVTEKAATKDDLEKAIAAMDAE